MKITLDNTSQATPFPHYWELCVGSCHAYTALRADWQQMMKKAHEELGFRYVRFHGLLSDDMCVALNRPNPFTGEENGIVYNFVNIDKIVDFLLSIGMKPFLELGFMPAALAAEKVQNFHYPSIISPPADWDAWGELIRRLTEHLCERYGAAEVATWFFEVWNEPNLPFFWAGTQAEYFKLYETAARAIKAVDATLRVGGPATSINAWIPEMRAFCEEHQVPLDFLTTHHYPSDDPLWRSGLDIETFFKQMGGLHGSYKRGVLKEMTLRTRAEAGDLPLYYTEWNISADEKEPLHDEPYAAAMIAKVLADNDGLVQGYSFWCVNDIFEENGQKPGAFHGAFGLQTIDGIPKPCYRAFQLYHHLGEERLPVQADEEGGTLELLATRSTDGLRLILHNHQVPGEPIRDEACELRIDHLPNVKDVLVQRIDAEHSNPKRLWRELGAPEYLSREVTEALQAASVLQTETLPFTQTGDTLAIRLSVPAQGVAALHIRV